MFAKGAKKDDAKSDRLGKPYQNDCMMGIGSSYRPWDVWGRPSFGPFGDEGKKHALGARSFDDQGQGRDQVCQEPRQVLKLPKCDAEGDKDNDKYKQAKEGAKSTHAKYGVIDLRWPRDACGRGREEED